MFDFLVLTAEEGAEMTMVNLEVFQFPSNNLNKQLANVAMNYVNEAIMITNKHNQIMYVNNKFEQITGYTFREVRGKTPKTLQSGIQGLSFYEKMKRIVKNTGKWQGEIWNRTKNGEIYLQSLSIIAVKNTFDQIEHFIGIFSDLFHNKSIENEYLHQTHYFDRLTTLPNRALFEKRVVSSLKLSEQTNENFAIIFFQLDNFTSVNEKYGYIYGDILLKRIALRLNSHLPEHSMVTRWNGTEFTSIIESISNEEEVIHHINQLQRQISTPVLVNGIEVCLQANFGICMYRKDGKTVSDLLSKANTALEIARREKKPYLFYHPKMGKPNNFFIMELELKKAIKEEQFELYYQPLISVSSSKLVGFEALIRWNHPTEGLISPVKFIPLAEQTGLIQDIGNIVFKKACMQLRKWKDKGFNNINISVNISMNQFRNQLLVENIREILQETNVNPYDIGIELTESSLIDNMEETTLKLHELKNLGLSIAIDDFGTGYSSLGYLIDFPIQRIKIDRTFTKVIGKNEKIKAIVSAINTMAETMDIEVVAEGIETEEQFYLMQKLNCNVVQGFLFDKPLPIEEVERKWLIFRE